MDHRWMSLVSTKLVSRKLRVIRFEFPYMQKRRLDGKRRGPDSKPKLFAAWRDVIDEIGDRDRLIVGGKSMGGRIASMVADEARVAGLVCLGYPFHPPGRPALLRTAHLESLRTPALILQGERDSFGSRAEVDGYPLSDSIQVVWLPDGDHSLKPRKKSGRTEDQNLDEACDEISRFVSSLPL